MKKINITAKKKENKEKDLIKDLKEITKYKSKHEDKKPVVVIEFPLWMIVAILLVISLIFFGEQLLAIALFLFMSFILMSALTPIVNWIHKLGISKSWSIGITYLFLTILLLGLFSVIVVPFTKGLQEMIRLLPSFIAEFLEGFNGITIGSFSLERQWFINIANDFSSRLLQVENINSLKGIAGTIGGAINILTLVVAVVIFSAYLISEGDQLTQLALLRIANDKKRKRVKKLIGDVEKRLGNWMLGQAVISTIAGVTMGVVLALLDVPFALPLGVTVSLLGAIPHIGTMLATVPAIFVAFVSFGWTKAILILVIYVIYQQIENNILIPKIMGSVVGLKPIVVLLGVVVFLNLFGVWGGLFAVPVIVVLGILYEFFIDLQKLEAEGIV